MAGYQGVPDRLCVFRGALSLDISNIPSAYVVMKFSQIQLRGERKDLFRRDSFQFTGLQQILLRLAKSIMKVFCAMSLTASPKTEIYRQPRIAPERQGLPDHLCVFRDVLVLDISNNPSAYVVIKFSQIQFIGERKDLFRLNYNKVGDSGVKLVSAALRNPECKIQRLWLGYVGLTDSGAEDLISALSTNPSLTELNLSGNKLGDSGVKLVSAALRNPECKIQRLGLSGVGLTDSGAEDLVSALSTNPSLTELDLSGNKLGDSGVKLVSAALRNPECKIQKLWLGDVGLTDSGAEDLVSALSTNPSLTDLSLSGNKLGDSGVKLVSAALRNPECKIQRLWLGDVGLTDSGAEDLVSALSTNPSLTDLSLSGNKLGDSGVKLVSAALRNPECKIQRLWLRNVGLTDSGAEDLVSALSTNPSLTDLDLISNSLTDRSVPGLHRLILTLPNLEQIR
ncbi:ribonuclease inhibitor-like [Hypanus sabinus]|uniref:ribonuclease inhibitor-like n=1 Tax=Hypanus sabinus TaxID=79690 RepID=UPI0028C4DA49|nr:ribonuclease inhibitor-like [Hypanus sabinus]